MKRCRWVCSFYTSMNIIYDNQLKDDTVGETHSMQGGEEIDDDF
jgi:hypothetical protein